MKRLLALLLACLMMFSLVACGNNSDKPDTPTDGGAIEQPIDKPDDTKPSEESTTPDSEDTTEPSEEPSDTIRENGQFPEDKNDLTEAELEYINGALYDKVVKAVIELDMDVLREYTGSQYLYGFERINENEKFRTMYLNTIGKSIYLPESRYIVKVDTQYVFAKWHTGLLLTNGVVPASVADITHEQVDSIYENIYKNAPVKLYELHTDCFYLDEGYVKFNTDLLLHDTEMMVSNMTPDRTYDNAYAEFIFAEEAEHLDSNYSTLKENQKFATMMFNKNIDEVVAFFHSDEADASDSTTKRVLEVLEDETKKAALQEWINEYMEVLCTTSSHHIYLHLTFDGVRLDMQPFYYALPEAELASLAGIHAVQWDLVGDDADDFADDWYELISTAEESGII